MNEYTNGRIAAHLFSWNSFITGPVLLSICPTLICLNKIRLKNRSLLAKNTIGSRLEPIDYLRLTFLPKEYLKINQN
jgi:hypothetical protein